MKLFDSRERVAFAALLLTTPRSKGCARLLVGAARSKAPHRCHLRWSEAESGDPVMGVRPVRKGPGSPAASGMTSFGYCIGSAQPLLRPLHDPAQQKAARSFFLFPSPPEPPKLPSKSKDFTEAHMADGTVTGLELRSLVTGQGQLRLSLEEVSIHAPGPDEVVVQVQASPINPSDLGLLLGPADMASLSLSGTAERPVLTAEIPANRMGMMKPRLDDSMAVGNEGAGLVVQAGANVQALLGKTVGMFGGAMYATHRKIASRDCMVLPHGATAADGASMFVNPLTALSMVDVMKREGHSALVHTAAASNLGQMLNKICLADGVPLVNIVRSAEQARILTDLGARHVVDSSQDGFQAALTDAVAETRATLAFEAIGGGKLANAILHAMEAAANRNATTYSRYGSSTFKQVYIYGGLDLSPTLLDRGFGLSWGVSGFLLMPYLQKIGLEAALCMRKRVASELTTTFASHYTSTISLREALDPEIVRGYARKATGEKYLIDPSR
jgi:NADPH:quinone reductase-like Zn-dependent oxidoreductase